MLLTALYSLTATLLCCCLVCDIFLVTDIQVATKLQASITAWLAICTSQNRQLTGTELEEADPCNGAGGSYASHQQLTQTMPACSPLDSLFACDMDLVKTPAARP